MHRGDCDAHGNPHYAPDDANMIANSFPLSPYDAGITHVCASKYVVTGNQNCGFVVGVYQATTSDPLVRIHLSVYRNGHGPLGTSTALDGTSIRIPYGALPQSGGDGHLHVRQPNGALCELWQVNDDGSSPEPTPGPVTKSDLYAASGTCAGNGGAYAADIDVTPGLIRADDIAGGNGDGTDTANPLSYSHAVYGAVANNREAAVWPSRGSDGKCKTKRNGGAEPAEGMYLYLDAQGFDALERWHPPAYLRPMQRFLGTLHKHGLIDLDSSGCDDKNRYLDTLTWGPQADYQKTGHSGFDSFLEKVVEPQDAHYAGEGGGNEQAIWKSGPGQYIYRMLTYRDVPGLSLANFHWLDTGCAQIAVEGSSKNAC